MKAKLLFLATRPGFLSASLVCVLIGLAAGWARSHRVDPLAALVVLVASVLVHAAADMLNDYDDHLSGADEANHDYISPLSGGSRFIQMGLLRAAEVHCAALTLLAIGVGLFMLLALRSGPFMLLIAGVCAFSALAYTGNPLRLAYRGLGELLVGLDFGPVLVSAGYYAQARTFPVVALWVTLPMAFLVAAILYVNEMPDYVGDRAAGKRTLVVRLGRRRASYGYALLMALTYLSIIAGVIAHQAPLQALLALGSLPLAVAASRTVLRHYDDPPAMSPANVQTIANQFLTGLLLAVAYCSAAVARPFWPLLIGSGLAVFLTVRTYANVDGMRRAFLAQKAAMPQP